MNTKIFNLIKENLQLAFNLPKYSKISIDESTIVDQLAWTPIDSLVRYGNLAPVITNTLVGN